MITGMTVPELAPVPSVRYHGKDTREYVAPFRRVIDIPGRIFPYPSPEECEDPTIFGEWINDGQTLICPGCGLDST